MQIKLNTIALVSVHCKNFSLHFGVYPNPDEVYKLARAGAETVHGYERWLWGFGTEIYDHSLEYFGMGPFLFACWVP